MSELQVKFFCLTYLTYIEVYSLLPASIFLHVSASSNSASGFTAAGFMRAQQKISTEWIPKDINELLCVAQNNGPF